MTVVVGKVTLNIGLLLMVVDFVDGDCRLKTRVQKPYPISEQNGQNRYPTDL